ncbi:MAG: ribosome-associated ATPase/putative transporter RbbA [Alphaproteobacteria bacterium]|nr:ribosome-associated ATPase/putative transporter RbbA [Alphaproteobacteria bacterium]
MDSPAPLATLTNVTHRYNGNLALDAVSLSIPRGEMLAVIGPDGVGKSTLLALIAGVRKIQEGTVHVLGGDLADASHRSAVCEQIAYMPQGLGRNLYPTLSVRENIDFFARLFGQGERERAGRIYELLEATGLAPFPDRPSGKLSGGMKQKLSLCCALVHDPELLILDEPTTGVDPLSRQQFWTLIDSIRARSKGMTVIVATAYMSEAERFGRLIAMDDGKILAAGTADELKARTRQATLEDAFIRLLPEEKRQGHVEISVPPRVQTGGPPAIEADHLTQRFGDFTAVDKVSFRIEPGEIFGFLGSNGCGKTTTMKMLTGLLSPTEGTAHLFGEPLRAGGLKARRRVGYMSQSFSLYTELTVQQNLQLHADLFGLGEKAGAARIAELLAKFELEEAADSLPESLPLGVRQRLQLAVAVLHRPEMLILDEPTSGVDPVARDAFWQLLIDLSRNEGVTIFISTHFMNEAERCDRISLMHAGKVLAVGEPKALCRARSVASLEEAFIAYLNDVVEEEPGVAPPTDFSHPERPLQDRRARLLRDTWRRIWAFAYRESLELMRDPIRLAFAVFGPLILMIATGYGITFDVEHLTYAALDQDRSSESRMLLEELSSSRYFNEKRPLLSLGEIDARLKAGDISLAIVIPPDFGRDIARGHSPVVSTWVDGSNTVRGETGRRYVEGMFATFLRDLSLAEDGAPPRLQLTPVETRFRYNQSFDSIYAIPPGILMLVLILIPAMLTALAVVREKEMGSITNFYAAPVRRFEFLLGKQLPYIAVALFSFATLVILMLTLFENRPSGSFLALLLGAVLYVTAATGFGLIVSTFVSSQVAATFATAIVLTVPAVNFSGMLYPVATLDTISRTIGKAFPTVYFRDIASGVFNKGLGLADLSANHFALAVFVVVYWLAATMLLEKQER